MKRFNWDDDNNDDNEEGFHSDMEDNESENTDQETLEYLERREALDLIQLELLQTGLNQKLLNKAVKLLEKSWFWKFRREQTKLDMINHTYNKLLDIISKEKGE